MTERDVARLERAVDTLTVAVNAMQVTVGAIGVNVEHIHDHEIRIRAIEQSGWKLSGAWSTVCLIGASLAGVAGLALGGLSIFIGG